MVLRNSVAILIVRISEKRGNHPALQYTYVKHAIKEPMLIHI
jgi:hypothetical protein